jgi:hypothetical protein
VWSVGIKSRLHFQAVGLLEDATHVKVVPHSFVGTREIVPLQGRITVSRREATERADSWQGSLQRAPCCGSGAAKHILQLAALRRYA